MKSTLLVALAFAVQSYAADPVCYQGVYGQVQAIFNWPPAQQYCGSNYPPSTVTVTRGRGGYYKRAPVPTFTPGGTTTTSSKSSAASVNANFARPVTITSSAGDPRSSMWSSISQGNHAVVVTFCSCIQNHPTVTVGSTTTWTHTSSSITTTSTSTSSSTTTSSPTSSCNSAPITAADGSVFNVNCNFNYYGGNTNKRDNNIITYYQGVANLASCVQSCDGTPGCFAVDYYRLAQGSGANQLAGDCFLLSDINNGGAAANGIDAATRATVTTSTSSSTSTSTTSTTSISTTTTSSSTSVTTSSSTSTSTSTSTSMSTSSSTSMSTSSSTTSSSTTTTSSSAATCTPGTFKAFDGAIYTRQCNFNYAGGSYIVGLVQGVLSLEACIQQCEQQPACSVVDFYRVAQGTASNQLAGNCFLLSSTAAGGATLAGVDAAFKVTTSTTTTSSMMTSTSSSSTTTSSSSSTTTSAVPCPTGCATGFFCDTTTPGGACRPSGNCNANANACTDEANCNGGGSSGSFSGGCYCQPDTSGENGYCQTGGACGTNYCSKNSDCPTGTICFVSCCAQNFCVNPLTTTYGSNNCPNPSAKLFAIRGSDNTKRQQGRTSSHGSVAKPPTVDYQSWYNRNH